jgi:undecaprenyl-diphosphatase
MVLDNLISLDRQLFLVVNSAWTPFLDAVMKPLSAIAVWIPMYLLLAVLCFFPKSYSARGGAYALKRPVRRDKFWLAALAAVGICILGYLACDWGSNLVKALVARPRPGYDAVASAGRFPTGTGSPYGFFSAHAANTFCFAMLISGILGHRWLRIVLLVWAALVSYSRIYLGCHFPLDVAVGMIYGVCVAILLTCVYKFAIDAIANKYRE